MHIIRGEHACCYSFISHRPQHRICRELQAEAELWDLRWRRHRHEVPQPKPLEATRHRQVAVAVELPNHLLHAGVRVA